jgi:hypothetical protein
MRTSPAVRRSWQRLLDGDSRAGVFDVRPDRFGMTRYRLTVYPPGITDDERRRLRVWRSWPVWGLLWWLGCQIVTSQFSGPWTALALATASTLAAGLVARAGAGGARVHTLHAMVMAGHHDPVATAARARLEGLADELQLADQQLRAGALNAVGHEAIWWRVYDAAATP